MSDNIYAVRLDWSLLSYIGNTPGFVKMSFYAEGVYYSLKGDARPRLEEESITWQARIPIESTDPRFKSGEQFVVYQIPLTEVSGLTIERDLNG